MTMGFEVFPLLEPYPSTFLTTSMPSLTWPKTTCFPACIKANLTVYMQQGDTTTQKFLFWAEITADRRLVWKFSETLVCPGLESLIDSPVLLVFGKQNNINGHNIYEHIWNNWAEEALQSDLDLGAHHPTTRSSLCKGRIVIHLCWDLHMIVGTHDLTRNAHLLEYIAHRSQWRTGDTSKV